MRIFIAIALPKEVEDEIKKIQSQLPEFTGKNTEIENLHLTLKFLGEIDKDILQKAKENLKKIKFKKFKAKLGEIGVFKENIIKIIWIKLENCDELQKEIDEKLKDLFKQEERFMSHITIARVKFIKDQEFFKKELKSIKAKEIEFEVMNFKLKESKLNNKGPEHKDIEIYNLE